VITPLNAVGLAMVLGGSMWYSQIRYNEARVEKASSK
jgi:hypothetical protein